MQVKTTNDSDTEMTLTIVPSAQELTNMKQHVLGHFRSRVKIAGFREGKAPLELVEKHIDDSQLQAEFLNEAINEFYIQTIRQENLRPVSNPEVNIVKFVPYTTLEFTAKVQVIGEITLPDYKKKVAAPAEVKITAADVTEVIKNLQQRSSEKTEVERALKDGDQAWITFKGADKKGEPIDGATGENYPLVLGSNSFIPGFEEQLIGLKKSETKTFTVTFPADYHAKELADKPVTFEVTIEKVESVTLPKLDDAFAASVGPFKTVEELKSDIKKQLQAERQNEADRKFEADLINGLADKTKVSIPEAVIDEQVERVEEQEKQNLMYRGQTWEEHLKEEGVTAEEHKAQKRPEAERGIKASLMLAEIAEKEGLEVSEQELDLRLQLLKGQYNDAAMQAELDKPESRREIHSRMLTEKTVAHLAEIAKK